MGETAFQPILAITLSNLPMHLIDSSLLRR